jgi:hypothetical protein
MLVRHPTPNFACLDVAICELQLHFAKMIMICL